MEETAFVSKTASGRYQCAASKAYRNLCFQSHCQSAIVIMFQKSDEEYSTWSYLEILMLEDLTCSFRCREKLVRNTKLSVSVGRQLARRISCEGMALATWKWQSQKDKDPLKDTGRLISNQAILDIDYSCVKHHINFSCPNSLKLYCMHMF